MSAPYLGDYAEDATVQFKWNTSDSNGASITRSTNGTIYVYEEGTTFTEVTTGVTDVKDFDGLTGVHHCRIVLTDAFYATGADYMVVLKAAIIDGQTVNAVLAHFSIENRFMRGTDSAALAATALSDTVWTNAKAAFLDHSIITVDTVVDGIQTDLSNVTDGLGALKALLDTISGYTDLIDDATNGLAAIKAEVEGLGGAAMRGTNNAALATALATHDTDIKAYVDLIDDATNGLAAIKAEVEGLAGAAMRGTDNAATEAKQDIIDTVVDGIQTDLNNATDGLGALKALIDTVDSVVDAIRTVTDNLPDSGALNDLAAILVDTGTTLDTKLNTIAAYLDAEIAAILADTGTTLDTKLNTIDTVVDAIKAITDNLPNSGSLSDLAAIKAITDNLPNSGNLNNISVADIIAGIADGSYDLQEMIRIIFSACCLKSAGGGTTTHAFRDSADGKDRISATVDALGNRTAVALDGS